MVFLYAAFRMLFKGYSRGMQAPCSTPTQLSRPGVAFYHGLATWYHIISLCFLPRLAHWIYIKLICFLSWLNHLILYSRTLHLIMASHSILYDINLHFPLVFPCDIIYYQSAFFSGLPTWYYIILLCFLPLLTHLILYNFTLLFSPAYSLDVIKNYLEFDLA